MDISSQPQFLTVFGHDPKLAKIELAQKSLLPSAYEDVSVFGKYGILSEVDLSCYNLASVVFHAEECGQIETLDQDAIITCIVTNATKRKITVTSPISFNDGVKKFKSHPQSRLKSVNFKKNELPNFGLLKSTECFIVCKSKSHVYIARIKAHTNQQLYKFLDEKLPHGNLRKGIMNLKLAHTLVNCAHNNVILDPFAGFGRTAFCGDVSKKYYLSDIDEKCSQYCQENKTFYLNTKEVKDADEFSISIMDMKPALETIQQFDIQTFTNGSVSIVTEGTLGRNFGKKVPIQAVLSEQRFVFSLWYDIFNYLHTHNTAINEIIFCVPFTSFYNQSKELVEVFAVELSKRYPSFSIAKLSDTSHAHYYSRGKSFIGHAILIAHKNE